MSSWFRKWIFGKQVTLDEMLRNYKRSLTKAMRDIDKERIRTESEEKKLIADMKLRAKQNQMEALTIMAKDLVRTRNVVKKLILMKANIQAVSLRIQTIRSQSVLTGAMRGITVTMRRLNTRLNLPKLQKILQEFEKQSNLQGMKEDMMSEAIDEAFDDANDVEESDALVTQVLDELGLQMTDNLATLPSNSFKNPSEQATVASPLVDNDIDLQVRLDNLRKL